MRKQLIIIIFLLSLIGISIGSPIEPAKGLISLFAFIISGQNAKAAIIFYVLLIPLIESVWRGAYVCNKKWLSLFSIVVYSIIIVTIGLIANQWWPFLLILGYFLPLVTSDSEKKKKIAAATSLLIICISHAHVFMSPHWTIIVGVIVFCCIQLTLLSISLTQSIYHSIECHAVINALIFAFVCFFNGGLVRNGILIDEIKADNYSIEIRQVSDANQYRSDTTQLFVGTSMGEIAANIADKLIVDSVEPCRRHYLNIRSYKNAEGRCPFVVELKTNGEYVVGDILQKLIDEDYIIADTTYESIYFVDIDSNYVYPQLSCSEETLNDIVNLRIRSMGHPFVIGDNTNELVPTDLGFENFPFNATDDQIADTLRRRKIEINKLDFSRMRIVTFSNGPRLGVFYRSPFLRNLYDRFY